MVYKGLQFINPAGLNDPSQHGYTHVAIAPPNTTTLYVSGQYGADENGNLVSEDFAAQVKQAFANLRIALAAAGALPEQVTKITLLIADYSEAKLGPLGAELQAMWSGQKPASTLIPVPRLALDGMLFEIDAVAVIPKNE